MYTHFKRCYLCKCVYAFWHPLYINNFPTRCNTKQSIYYSASSLHTFRVSTTPIMSTKNCNYSLRYRAAISLQRGQAFNNFPTRCNTKQSIYYSASMFRVSTTPIIRSTQNCNYSLRYCAATSLQRGQAWPRCRVVAAQKK